MQPNDIINDRYLLVRSIGRGSFGEVWLATDQKLGFNVAIKIYIALDTRGLNEFKNEFKSVYNLHHPNLLRADYFDNVGNNPYLVMPYCPSSVGDKVGKMDESEIWDFIKGVAAGLAYLHSNDIIHRDIKPDNILKDEQGNYVISDFGLSTKMRSTLRKASARQNDSSNQSGTIGYMAPEMFSSKPNAVKATDIWALGATIYEIATGEMPFCGQGGIMELHGAELPELPSHFSKELGELMSKCLAKDTWDRPTAQDIIDSLMAESSNNRNNKDVVSRETYEYEVNTLKKIIENERVSHKLQIQQLENAERPSTSKWMKVFGCIASIAVVILVFICSSINSSRDYWEKEYNNTQTQLQKVQSELSALRSSYNNINGVLDKLMLKTPILATNIDVRDWNGSYGSTIYNNSSTYMTPKATFISSSDISNKTIYVKMYRNGSLYTGDTSPRGYSYEDKISLTKYKPEEIELQGWGNEKKGSWGVGTHRVELWVDGKCIGSKTFTIK